MFFLGEYQHSLDAKGRLILPAEFRPGLAQGAVIVGTDGNCLAVHPVAQFERVASEVEERAKQGGRDLASARSFFATAKQVNLDGQGRVAISENLRQYAGLERDVAVIGANSRVEIWDATRWRDQKAEGEAALAESGGFGI
jgi:MraZ protein